MLHIILTRISCFVLFANELLLAVYFICILDYGNDVKWKASLRDFLIWVQNVSVETTCNINNAFGPRTANEHTVQWWLKEFCKGDESLEDKEHSGWPSEVDNNREDHWTDNWSTDGIIDWSSYNRNEKLPKNSKSTILWSFGIWSKLEMWKSSNSGCLMSWPQIKKISSI